MISDTELEKYLTAGKIAKKALKYARDLMAGKKKINLYTLCEKIERLIIDHGAIPAFPCNVSYNDIAAHYTPIEADTSIVFNEGVLKIDVGAMVDGYIADTAISIARGKDYEYLAKMNLRILNEVLEYFKPGVKLGEIGRYVESEAKKMGLKPIANLSGHKVDRYDLHAGKNVPNVYEPFSPTIKEGEVYAVEPFLTFDKYSGYVKPGKTITIFSLKKIKRIKKNRELDEFKNKIYNTRRYLPFTPRWFYKDYGKEKTLEFIRILKSERFLNEYPVLIEESGGVVSQYEHTIIVLEKGSIVTTI
ncbi:type II methionyl aminopeptidase [Candidatus Geothermarchaeota archaeon]|nr:MAG: type II methionyl aminopeptidase [Candidatus Geothermarchaeota archaeon]